MFQSNRTNTDRALNVLKNLTLEFTQPHYGGIVTGSCKPTLASRYVVFTLDDVGIQLMNEPRLSDDGFTMDELKSFYTEGAQTIRSASATSGVQVVMHGVSSHLITHEQLFIKSWH